MGWNVLVHNGVLQLVDPGSPSRFLLSRPPGKTPSHHPPLFLLPATEEEEEVIWRHGCNVEGAYTTTRTASNGSRVLLWSRHLHRLSHSFHLLLEDQDPPHQSGSSSLADLVKPCMEVGLQRAMELRRDGQELAVTIYVNTSPNNKEVTFPDIYVHLSSFDGAWNVKPAHLTVMGKGRSTPTVKSSEWVRSRQALEQLRPPNVTENLLSNDGNALLEGTITNFFVVQSNRSDINVKAKEGLQDDVQNMELKPWKDSEIRTACCGVVLPGIIRQLIIEICKEQNICLQEVAPLWSEHHLWKEAFITNSIRLIQPVESIQAPSTSKYKRAHEHFHLETCDGMMTQMLQEFVWKKALAESISTSSFLQS